MFGQEPGNERRQGVMNQSIVTKLDAPDITYYVLHTRGENPRSVLITVLTKHYRKHKPSKTMSEIDEFVLKLVSAITAETTYATLQAFERVKDTKLVTADSTTETTLEAATNAASGSCLLGVVDVTEMDK